MHKRCNRWRIQSTMVARPSRAGSAPTSLATNEHCSCPACTRRKSRPLPWTKITASWHSCKACTALSLSSRKPRFGSQGTATYGQHAFSARQPEGSASNEGKGIAHCDVGGSRRGPEGYRKRSRAAMKRGLVANSQEPAVGANARLTLTASSIHSNARSGIPVRSPRPLKEAALQPSAS